MSKIPYDAPKRLGNAVALLTGAKGAAGVRAGGTNLMIQMVRRKK